MRSAYILLAAILSLTSPAFAGDVTVANGLVTWKSTKCAAPAVPPSLLGADRLSPANDMNMLVTQYNDYTKLMHTFMSCMSEEAKADADMVSEAVVNSAQASILETQKGVDTLGAPLKQQP